LTLGENVISVRLIDRRFFGRDWLQTPSGAIGGLPPLMTFGSLKGGVGRTTAIFVLAMELSRQGANVLLIDLDLEAPGLGSLIFEKDERPEFGVLDFLVENGLGGVSDAALASFVGTSRLTDLDSGAGRVDLVPATGAATIRAPENMLAKLARGMVEDLSGEGPPVSLSGQIRTLVQRMAGRAHYDAVLVDARAGLSELTAGPLLALGGTILLFATDHPHTFEGYRYLMAHLATLPVPSDVDDWRRRIHFVHSMSSASPKDQENFNDKLFDLLAETFYEEDQDDEVFTFSLNEEDAPHRAWRIFFDGQFQGLDPLKDPQVLEQRIHKAVFGDFLESSIDDLFSPAGVD
jgi:cellulose biosynthesis protein BcsQ